MQENLVLTMRWGSCWMFIAYEESKYAPMGLGNYQ